MRFDVSFRFVFLLSIGPAVGAAAASSPCTIEQISDDGVVTSTHRPVSVDFSGRRVALELSWLDASNPDGGWEIVVFDRLSGTFDRISDSSFPEELVYQPAISGDGSRLAYQLRSTSPSNSIEVLKLVDRRTDASLSMSPSERSPTFHAALDGFGARTVFVSPEDLSGDSPFQQNQVFLRDASTGEIRRITHASTSEPPAIDFFGRKVLIRSYDDQEGNFPFPGPQLYIYDVALDQIRRLTSADDQVEYGDISGDGRTVVYTLNGDLVAQEVGSGELQILVSGANTAYPSVNFDGTRVAFVSSGDLVGDNPDNSPEVFLYDRLTDELIQVTASRFNNQYTVDINGPGDVLVFPFQGNPTGTDFELPVQVFSASCPVGPSPPPGPPLLSAEVPGFAFHVRFSDSTGDGIDGVLEPQCIAETACVSGALPGRSELFLRVVGPKLNGFLWPTLVKFSTSTVEVWVEQLASGIRRYYRLAGARPGHDDLPGLFDRTGFLPDPGIPSEATSASTRSDSVPEPPGTVFTSDRFPDFRFHVRISAGDQEQEVRKELDCIDETLCLSGAIPGRSEVFLRVVGPKPNGRLWPTIVKFTTSTLEVWVEQVSTGETKYYRIEGASPGQDDLTGLFDRDGFVP